MVSGQKAADRVSLRCPSCGQNGTFEGVGPNDASVYDSRTGLASLVTAGLFALAIFFVPLIALVGQQVPYVDKTFISPAVAPALVMVGYLMMRLVQAIDWADASNAIPAFLIIAGVPLTFSISAGIGFGIIGFIVVMVATGRVREIHPLMWALVPLFVAFYADDWLSVHVF